MKVEIEVGASMPMPFQRAAVAGTTHAAGT
jgi:hypothetical protein